MATNVMFLQNMCQVFRHLRCRSQIFLKKSIERKQIQSVRLCSTLNQDRNEESEDEIRNISRLPKHLQRRLNQQPPTEEDLGWHPHWNRPSFRRGLYATYGSNSGAGK